MRALSELVVRTANLAEAEGRLARRKALEVIAATLLWLGSVLIIVAGLVVLSGALYAGLRLRLPAYWALSIVGGLQVAVGSVGILVGRRIAGGGR
ncbi:MAG: hypothetical protein HYV26_24355 [Candidatus Hydrogenedentes bacterium]|nr:hypothetical protein [Candidatus Hydrogenedentota bacterium]